MTRVLQAAHLLVLLAVIVVLGVTGWRMWGLADSLEAVLNHADGAVNSLNLTLEQVQRPCGEKLNGQLLPCGTLANLDKTTLAARSTLTHLDMAVAHEDRNLSTADARMGHLFDAGDADVQKFGVLLDSANAAVKALQPVEMQATALIAEVRPAAQELPAIAKHVNGMTDSGDKMLADAQEKEHQLLHPNKKKLTFWGAIDGGVMWFHSHLMPPIF